MSEPFAVHPRRPLDPPIGRAAGLLPALEELVEANLQFADLRDRVPADPAALHERLRAVERAWVRALDAGWDLEELQGLGLEPRDRVESASPNRS